MTKNEVVTICACFTLSAGHDVAGIYDDPDLPAKLLALENQVTVLTQRYRRVWKMRSPYNHPFRKQSSLRPTFCQRRKALLSKMESRLKQLSSKRGGYVLVHMLKEAHGDMPTALSLKLS